MDIQSALEHQRTGHLAEAARDCAQILNDDPKNADALHLMGRLASQLGDFDAAIAFLSDALKRQPENVAYLSSLGAAYRGKRDFDMASRCYSRMLELDPNSASGYFGLGNTWQALGNTDEAAGNFAAAIRANPAFFEAYYNLANIQKSVGQYAAAIDNYQKAIAWRPGFADAHHNMGGALYALGRLDEAMVSFERALASNLPETHNSIGNILFDRGLFDRALERYEQALAGKADFPEVYNNIGNTLRQLGKPGESAAAFHQAIRLKPDYVAAHLNLGDLLLDFNPAEATNVYEAAVSIAPHDASAHFKLGVGKYKQNDLRSARESFEHAVDLDPGYVDAIFGLGAVNGKMMLPAAAEQRYRRVLELDAGHVDAHINLSAILMGDGRVVEAKEHIDFAYSRSNVSIKRSAQARRTVLILFDAGKGNLNLTHLFSEKKNNIIDWMIEYASETQAGELPPYDIAFNAMGDADVTGQKAANSVRQFLRTCAKPLLNHPDRVAATARDKLPALLAGIDNLLIPPVRRAATKTDWDHALLDQLPLLIRPVDTHGGVGMVLASTRSEIEQAAAAQSGPVYASRFVDYRGSDSWFRKYRMIFIDRTAFPYHVAISRNWMVHYFNADMESHPWKLEEEARFLRDPESVLGGAGMQAIASIGARLDLDYAGIDFSVMPDGKILVFEANPTMLVHPEAIAGTLAHKNVYVNRILDAFDGLLDRSTRAASLGAE